MRPVLLGSLGLLVLVAGMGLGYMLNDVVNAEASEAQSLEQLETEHVEAKTAEQLARENLDALPRLGEWINGSLVDVMIQSGGYNETTTAWSWTVQARFHNGTTPVNGIKVQLGMLDRGVQWKPGGDVSVSVESRYARAIPGEPVSAQVVVQDTDNISHVEETYYWAPPPEARNSYP